MDFYSILISILRRFPGCVFVVISVIHGILVFGGGGLPQPRGIGVEEGGDPGGPPPSAFVIDHAIVIIVYAIYAVYAVCGGGHRWELPGNYPVFTVVMANYHYVARIWRILVTPNFFG